MARNAKIIAADVTLKRAFPKDLAAPQLLFDFAAWPSNWTKREIGVYRLKPRDAAGYVPSGVSIEDDLALFFDLSDGGWAAPLERSLPLTNTPAPPKPLPPRARLS